MGWSFTYGQKRAELIAERTKTQEWDHEGVHVKDVVLAHCFRGGVFAGVFYAVHERTRTEKSETSTERWLEVTLMQCHTFAGYGPSWGYKDMEETMGPCEVSCPLGYLEMVPEPTCEPGCKACAEDRCCHKWAREWRARVRAYHARRAAQNAVLKGAKPGDVIELEKGCDPTHLELKSVRPLRGTCGLREYMVKASWVVRVIPKEQYRAEVAAKRAAEDAKVQA
jgi:hypothetical protein